MSVETIAIAIVVMCLATAWLITKDKAIEEDEQHEQKAADVFSRHIEEHRNLAQRAGYIRPVDNFPTVSVSVQPGKKQARRSRGKAGGKRKTRPAKGTRK